MTEEFNLSSKRFPAPNWFNAETNEYGKQIGINGYREEDVKEFIKRLKEDCENKRKMWKEECPYSEHLNVAMLMFNNFEETIDKLAGDKLI